jgi:Tfp pilus assembly protein PilF
MSKLNRFAALAFLFLLINSGYIAALPQATIFYMANVLAHLGVGLALMIFAVPMLRRYPLESFAFLAAGAPALYLVVKGNTLDQRNILWAHIILAVLAVLLIGLRLFRTPQLLEMRRGFTLASAFLVLVPGSAMLYNRSNPPKRIVNPASPPMSMDEEGAGKNGPFAPSSAQTNTGTTIPSNFFMESEVCGRCHVDAFEQWKSSVHHFASFNNQFYRKSIEYMQEVNGVRSSKWCAGCHDHAVFFNGRFDKPIKDQIDTPEAQAGLGCTSCHAITHVASSMGNGDFTVEYPALHDLAASKNPYMQKFDYFLTYLNPEPHRRTFLKPFMKQSEFCATCHKVHLDVPVNNYRWIRGFNDYDNWQASGVSGEGARSFYYPPKSSTCADCHMPMLPSKDPGNRDGKIHSHRFAAANMAVAYANKDQKQMDETEKFLKSGFITVDIFSVSPVTKIPNQVEMRRRADSVAPSTTFAVGEEAEQTGEVFLREVGQMAAPVGASPVALEPGTQAQVDVVVRTRKIGHFFPGGTVDSFDIWLELRAEDADGKTIYWSGSVDDNGKGPVEKGAHFYRAFLLDGEGNHINKRNAWQARSTMYVRLIPPGAADVAHFLVDVPKSARGPIKFHAKLNYRKFSWFYTQFAYAGQPKPGQDPALLSKNANSMEYSLDPSNIPANVSGQIKDRIPDLPILTLAEAKAEMPVGKPSWTTVARKQDRERWNDWGIGLLLQGDLKGAEYAFLKVTEAEPGYADGWLNVARALIQEGETERAKTYIDRAMQINPELGRIWFFKAAIQKADGDYDGAIQSLRKVLAKYPRDRVAVNQLGRVLFLKRQYAEAIEALKGVAAVDPEDVQMHYTLMLSYRGLGDIKNAEREEKLFRRFKADESAQAITERPRRVSPEDNNERQMIHRHESAHK